MAKIKNKFDKFAHICCSLHNSILDILRQIEINKEGFVFLVDKNNALVQVITDGDIRRLLIQHNGDINLNTPCLQFMQNKNIHFAVAIDEFGSISGIITLEDLVEEIFGNIYDEHDSRETPHIQQITDHQWRVQGNTDLEELSKALAIDFPQDEDYNTIGGYIYSHLRSIPKDGTTKKIQIDDLIFHIIKIKDRRIKEVIITKKV